MAKNFKAWPDQWPQSLNYPEQPVYNFLNQTAARMELTYSELKNLADRFAKALISLGIEKGEKIAIHLPNCLQFAIAYYGAL